MRIIQKQNIFEELREKITPKDFLILASIIIFLNIIWGLRHDLRVAGLESVELTYLNWVVDPSLYGNALLSTSVYECCWLYPLLGFFVKVFEPTTVIFCVFIISNTLAILTIFWLSLILFQNKYTGYLSIFLLLSNWQTTLGLGGTAPIAGYYIARCIVVVPLLLISIILFLKGRVRISLFTTGLLCNFHPSFAFYVAAMFGCYFLWNIKKLDKKLIFEAGLLLILGAVPFLIWFFNSQSEQAAPLPFDQWLQLMHIRGPGHHLPFSWPWKRYINFLSILFLFFSFSNFNTPNERLKKIYMFSLAILLLCVIGTIFVEIIPVAFIFKLTLFRSTQFFIIFSVIISSNYFINQFRKDSREKWLTIPLVACFFTTAFKIFYPLLTLICILKFIKKKNLFMGICSILLFALSFCVWRMPQYDLSYRDLYFCIAILVTLLFVYIISSSQLRYKTASICIIIAITAIGLAPTGFYERFSENKYNLFRSQKDVQLWIKNNTPKDKLIVTPPNTEMWSGYSQRGVFFNFKSLISPIYNPNLGEETIKRASEYVEDIFSFPTAGSTIYALVNAYNSWQAEDFERIASKYGVSHAVVYPGKKLAFEKVYENEHFGVYDLNNRIFNETLTKIDLPNSSFEEFDENDIPLHWDTIENKLSVVTTGDQGKNACRVTANDPSPWLFSGKGNIKKPPIDRDAYKIEGESYYKIKAKIKGDRDLSVFLYLIEYDKNGKVSYTRCQRVVCFDDYQPLVAVIKTKATSVHYRVGYRLYKQSGTFYVDQVEIEKLDFYQLSAI